MGDGEGSKEHKARLAMIAYADDEAALSSIMASIMNPPRRPAG